MKERLHVYLMAIPDNMFSILNTFFCGPYLMVDRSAFEIESSMANPHTRGHLLRRIFISRLSFELTGIRVRPPNMTNIGKDLFGKMGIKPSRFYYNAIMYCFVFMSSTAP